MLDEPRPAGNVERILHLKKAQVVGALPAHDLAAVAEVARERLFPKGSVLLREGEPISAAYFVIDGKVHLRRDGADIGHAGPGAGVGGIGIVARDETGIGAVAETDVLTLELDADTVLELLEDNFTILRHLLRETCRQLVELWIKAPEESVAAAPRLPVVTAPLDLDLVERIFLLRQAAPFAKASINALAELSRGFSELQFDPGVALWKQGEPARHVFLIVSGEVECSSTHPGVRFRAGSGSPLGALEAMAALPRWYDAVAFSRTVTLTADVEGLFDVFEDNFDMAMDYLAVMSKWLLGLLVRLAERDAGPLREFYGCDEA